MYFEYEQTCYVTSVFKKFTNPLQQYMRENDLFMNIYEYLKGRRRY